MVTFARVSLTWLNTWVPETAWFLPRDPALSPLWTSGIFRKSYSRLNGFYSLQIELICIVLSWWSIKKNHWIVFSHRNHEQIGTCMNCFSNDIGVIMKNLLGKLYPKTLTKFIKFTWPIYILQFCLKIHERQQFQVKLDLKFTFCLLIP